MDFLDALAFGLQLIIEMALKSPFVTAIVAFRTGSSSNLDALLADIQQNTPSSRRRGALHKSASLNFKTEFVGPFCMRDCAICDDLSRLCDVTRQPSRAALSKHLEQILRNAEGA